MRTLVLILMIALLPMRMWAAEGMAVRMAADQAGVATDVSAMESMPDDCPMLSQAKAGVVSEEDAPKAASPCMACHLCATCACLPEVAFRQDPAATGPPVPGHSAYTSADQLRDLRPPID